MGNLVLNGATSGSTTLQPTDATTQTITLPANSGTVITTASSGKVIPAAALPAGTVLQVVSATTTTQTQTTSATYVTTGFSASITPTSATSKILVRFVGNMGISSSAAGAFSAIYRNSTEIQQHFVCYASGGSTYCIDTNEALDSPNTTSSVTYTLYFASQIGANTATHNVTVGGYTDRATVILMEIAA